MQQCCLHLERKQPKYNFIEVIPTTESVLSMPGLIFQRKFDGVCAEVIKEGDIRIVGKGITKGRVGDYTSKFPELVDALQKLNLPDGTDFLPEIVIFDQKTGMEDFSLVQARTGKESNLSLYSRLYPATMIIHDVASVGNRDVSHESYLNRKNALKPLVAGKSDKIFFIGSSTDGKGEWERVQRLKFEGIIARDPEETLGRNVRKLKRVLSEDVFCIGEYTPSISDSLSTFEYMVGDRKKAGLFANLVCYQFSALGKLFHVCDVGGGFSMDERIQIQQMLDLGMISKESPLVLEVKANARFEDGKLRHNTFVRLRNDKAWNQCIVKEVI
ncbi:MAG: hypothetical protein WCE94_03150 [Candidatus Methanoperedens sp.]